LGRITRPSRNAGRPTSQELIDDDSVAPAESATSVLVSDTDMKIAAIESRRKMAKNKE
jgi:hypothetical protein